MPFYHIPTYIKTIKQVITAFLAFNEELQVFEYPFFNRNFIVVPNWIFTRKIKDDHKFSSCNNQLFLITFLKTDNFIHNTFKSMCRNPLWLLNSNLSFHAQIKTVHSCSHNSFFGALLLASNHRKSCYYLCLKYHYKMYYLYQSKPIRLLFYVN